MRYAYKILIKKPEEKLPLGKYKLEYEDNITIYVTKEGM
jgi:hypothetical protein